MKKNDILQTMSVTSHESDFFFVFCKEYLFTVKFVYQSAIFLQANMKVFTIPYQAKGTAMFIQIFFLI